MMICKADFEELFPELFQTRADAGRVSDPTLRCLARWEEDGGRVAQANPGSRPEDDNVGRSVPVQPNVIAMVSAFRDPCSGPQ